MSDDFSLQLLCGGRTLCEPVAWSKSADSIDECYKFYFPVAGRATVVVDGRERAVESGHVYFISGFHIDRQFCEEPWDVYWVHVAPESLSLTCLLSSCPPFHEWPGTVVGKLEGAIQAIGDLFAGQGKARSDGERCRLAALRSHVQALLLYLVEDLLARISHDVAGKANAVLQRLAPSISHMDRRLGEKMSLAEIAAESHLAPNYFHRLFKDTFGMTPLEYLTRRRLDLARRLLAGTSLSVREVAFRAGYPSEFYFSRVFKKHVKTCPADYRRKRGSSL